MGVSLRQLGDGIRPIDGNRHILRMNSVLGFWRVSNRVQVEEVTILGQGLKSMGKAGWNQERSVVFSRENLCVPSHQSGRARAQVNGYVEDTALQACHDFGLGVGRVLKVQTPNHALLLCPRVIDLRNDPVPASLAEFLVAEDPSQKASAVSNRHSFESSQAREWRLLDGEPTHSTSPVAKDSKSAISAEHRCRAPIPSRRERYQFMVR